MWLAKAFGVAIPVDAPKTVILPMMETAQTLGQLTGRPKDEYAYFRAQYNSDVVHPMDHPVFPGTVQEQPEPAPEKTDRGAGSEFRRLQQECKRLGIKCFGWGEEKMRDAIARVAPLKEQENANQDAG